MGDYYHLDVYKANKSVNKVMALEQVLDGIEYVRLEP